MEESKNMIRLGDRIKAARKKTKISAKEFSEKAGIPYSTYSNYENNNRTPSIDVLKNIASHLQVSVSALMGFPDDLSGNQDALVGTLGAALNTTDPKEITDYLSEITYMANIQTQPKYDAKLMRATFDLFSLFGFRLNLENIRTNDSNAIEFERNGKLYAIPFDQYSVFCGRLQERVMDLMSEYRKEGSEQ